MRVVAGIHSAFEDVPEIAVLALHIFVLRGMVGMGQAAHGSAFGSINVHAAGQQSQWRCEQRYDHENGLNPAHVTVIIAQQSRAGKPPFTREASSSPVEAFEFSKTSR